MKSGKYSVEFESQKKEFRVQLITALTNLVQHLGKQLWAGDPAYERTVCCLRS